MNLDRLHDARLSQALLITPERQRKLSRACQHILAGIIQPGACIRLYTTLLRYFCAFVVHGRKGSACGNVFGLLILP